MKYLAPIPKQFVDQNGLPLSDGKVHVYISGDTQYANVYQDADGNELMPNPARLDSNGAWVGFVTAGVPLDYVVEDKDGNVQFEYEKVIAGSGTANVAIEPILTSGTKIAECWVDRELLELFAPDGATVELPLRIVGGKITNNGTSLTCTGTNAWAEGNSTKSMGQQSHAEGYSTEASSNYAHAEGCYSKALQGSSHAEGFNTMANGVAAHAEGYDTVASGNDSHAEGKDTTASGACSHAGGTGTRATGDSSTAIGKYNDDGTALFVVGNGTADDARSDAFKVDSNGETWVKISGVLTKITSLGGGSGIPIYATLQDAITDQANLPVGTIFETNGFHTSGDGGAARYLVSSTGTANGMDIVSMGGGKLAIAQLKGSAYTEQIGYVVNSSQADVGPYIKRLLAMGIQTVKFYPTGGAPTACYCIRDMLDLDRSDYHNVGVQLEGADIGQTSGYATWFNFQPSGSNTGKVAIKIHARTTRIKNIALIYGAGASDAGVRDSSAGICFDSTGNSSYQTSSYGTVLENLTIQGFNTAILSMGTSPYLWHVDCEKITCSANNTHVSLDGQAYCTTFRNCLFNSPDVQSVYLGEPFTIKFDSCNFGIDDRGTCIVRAVKWVVPTAPVDEKRGLVLFQNCNMEVEYRGANVPQNNKHLFIYADDNSLIDYEFDNCCFIYTPQTRENVTSDRMMSLGAGSSIIIRNSIGPYADVNYTGNEFYGKDYDKYFFDESRLPEKKIGSLKLEHVIGVAPLVFLDSAHLPCLKRDNDVILYDNNTDLTQFKGLGDGTILFNLDTFVPSVRVAGKLQACASAPTGVVRIGNELYDYVTIDGRKWITRNLNLRIATRQHTVWDHLEWGQYYKYSDLSAIQSALPSGWRIPNSGDVTSLIGDGTSTRAHNLQSLGVSYWTSATNSTGFSALPSTWWNKPNVTPHATFKQYAFYWTSVTEGTNVKNISIAPNAVSSGGWTAGEAASLWIPLRVCCDA